jgi:crotonobetainyl-CoA:carnitine CoA-transferase CaiB-like acyl-CoA transferase
MVAGNNAHFPRFVKMIDRPELLEDPRFATLEQRMIHVEAIEGIAAEWIARHTADEVLAALRQAELPSARIRTIEEVATDPYMREAGHIVDVVHPKAGVVPMQGPPVGLGTTPSTVRRPPPMLGEHADEVLSEWLSMPSGEIGKLRSATVI